MSSAETRSGRRRRRPPAARVWAGTVQVGDTAIGLRTAGTVEGPRHTVVPIHGAGTSSAVWHALIERLGHQAYVIAPDLPGHGRSEGDGCPDAGAYRSFMRRFLDGLAIGWPVVLAGHCLGAGVALEFAAAHPERVAGLVLLACGDRQAVPPEMPAAAARGEEARQLWLDQFMPVHARVALRESAIWTATRPEVRCLDLQALARLEPAPLAARIRVPVLVLGGAHDPISPVPAIRAMRAAFVDAELTVVEDAARMIMLEAPDQVADALSAYLTRLTPPLVPSRRY